MQSDLEEIINHGEYNICDYPLCRHCVGRVEFSGTGNPPNIRAYSVL
ncbi:CRISPR-associated endonuclease Cas2 [Desulfobacter sp.]